MNELILQIDDVKLQIIKTNPAKLKVNALGKTTSVGWTNAQLVLSKAIPLDGIYELEFMATPPGTRRPILTAIEAEYLFDILPEDLKGVRVIASTNSVVCLLEKAIEQSEGENVPSGYWTPKRIDYRAFQLSKNALTETQRNIALRQLSRYISSHKETFLGFQATQKLDFSHLSEYLDVSVNNIGDSFANPNKPGEVPPDGYYTLNCKWMERAVLDYYAELWNAKYPRLTKEDDPGGKEWPETYWGYIVSMGSTEGNLLAMRNGRDYLNGTRLEYDEAKANAKRLTNENDASPGAHLLEYLNYQSPESDNENEYTPVLFFSRATHYSVKKIGQVLQIDDFNELGKKKYPGQCPITPDGKWTDEPVHINKDGSIDLKILGILVNFFAEKKHPILMNFNYGTTWTGGYDNVGEAIKILVPILKKHGMYEREVTWKDRDGNTHTSIRNGFWFHVDGALGAGYAPFVKLGENKDEASVFPDFDFRQEIHSIAMSGHKWVGAPWPCGIYMTKNKFLISNDVPSYVGSMDSTLAGSRNSFSAMLMWDYLSKSSYAKQSREIQRALALVGRTYAKLIEIYDEESVKVVPGSVMIRFPKPSIDIVKKYALSSSGNESHILMMRTITEAQIDVLIADLKRDQEK
ncbi:MAG: histidine decarboxylase [Crocinitomix sp.]|jgi:histidine decarboxylase